MIPIFEKTGLKDCMCLQTNIGTWPESSLCVVLEGLQTAGLGSWHSFGADREASILCSLEQCIKVVLPGLIRSIRGCVSGALSHTQHGPCLYSSAVVLRWGEFRCWWLQLCLLLAQ